jgi:hypothetical protein
LQASGSIQQLEPEYPVCTSLGKHLWILSDGSGRFYLLRTSESATSATPLASYEVIKNNELVPSRVHSAVLYEEHIVLLLSNRGEVKKGPKGKLSVMFELAAMRVPLPLNEHPFEETIPAELLWKRLGQDIPSYVNYQAANWLVCAGSTFKEISEPVPVRIPDPLDDKMTGIEPTNSESQPTGQPPPPYSWTQTSDSLTVAFPLPAATPKSHIHVTIGPKHLSLLIKMSEEESTFPLPRYAMKELWDQVNPSESLWTWDKEGERTVGLLTLHLEKRHQGTKWSHVFAREGTSSNDPEVLETVDPSEMWKIREALEKYTSELQSGTDGGIGGEMPSLATGEMDPSVDAETGRRLTASYFDVLTGEEIAPNSAYQEILAFPLPHSPNECRHIGLRSLVIKNGIDGPLFTGPIVPSVDLWEHVSTFPALGFVLASKRDTRFSFHLGSSAAVAIESGGREASPNMYIYYDAKGNSRAKQGIVRLGNSGTAGSLLGVAGIETQMGLVVTCLRERELVIVRNIL